MLDADFLVLRVFDGHSQVINVGVNTDCRSFKHIAGDQGTPDARF
jgi:hypothetical protein